MEQLTSEKQGHPEDGSFWHEKDDLIYHPILPPAAPVPPQATTHKGSSLLPLQQPGRPKVYLWEAQASNTIGVLVLLSSAGLLCQEEVPLCPSWDVKKLLAAQSHLVHTAHASPSRE